MGFPLWSSRYELDDGMQWPWCHHFLSLGSPTGSKHAKPRPSFSGWKLHNHWCFNGGPKANLFCGHGSCHHFQVWAVCFVPFIYNMYIYIWYMIHKYYWPILIDYMFKWCMCFHDVSCADTQRFTAGPNFGWCIPPGEAPLSQGLQPSLLTLSSLTALATFILVYMINMNIIQI
jgi:hypothetical protein